MSVHAAIMADIERDETVAELRAEVKRLTALLEGRANDDTAHLLQTRLGVSAADRMADRRAPRTGR